MGTKRDEDEEAGTFLFLLSKVSVAAHISGAFFAFFGILGI